jgi:hypothetical protein
MIPYRAISEEETRRPFIRQWNCFSEATRLENMNVRATYDSRVNTLSSRHISPQMLSLGEMEKMVEMTADIP